jgi:Tol biopolymer transport system component
MKYVFDCLEARRLWRAPAREPSGPAFVPMLEAEETYRHLSAKARRLITDGFCGRWSPDRSKLAFSLGVHGYSGVAIYDPKLQAIELLITPGKDPVWSPDGRQIAFVRDCGVLRLPDLTAAERRSQIRGYTSEEVWIMNADGTRPRRLARGGWPSWSQDGSHLYYQSRVDSMLYSISTEETKAQPTAVFPNSCDHPSVSPDGKLLAYVESRSLKIVELASQKRVAEWEAPLPIWGGEWSPDGRRFSLGGVNRVEDRTGLWIYDLDRKDAVKVLSGQIVVASWSAEETQLLFSLGPPYFEIWAAELDPKLSTIESLGPGQTLQQHYLEILRLHTRRIEADPNNADSYLVRAQHYHYLDEEENVRADMDAYSDIVNRQPRRTEAYDSWHNTLVAQQGSPEFLFGTPENLGPLVNTMCGDSGPCLSPDGLTLYFCDVPFDLSPNGHGGADLWTATRATTYAPWGQRANMGPTLNTSFDDGTPSISSDGLTLYFSSNRPGGSGAWDLWMTTRLSTSDPWGAPTNLGSPVNRSYGETFPSISTDGLELYFSEWEVIRPDGHGDGDIWVTRRKTKEDPWGTPVNLGPIVNTEFGEASPCIGPDGLTLFYWSMRPGGLGGSDIWVTTRETREDPWDTPVNLGIPVNSPDHDDLPSISVDGSTLYFSSTREGGCGGYDLWQVSILQLPKNLARNDQVGTAEETIER